VKNCCLRIGERKERNEESVLIERRNKVTKKMGEGEGYRKIKIEKGER
jgi:hypothetical protein